MLYAGDPLVPRRVPVDDAVVAGLWWARAAGDFHNVAGPAEVHKRERVGRAHVDAAVRHVVAALTPDRPRRGVHVLAAVGDMDVGVHVLVVTVGRVDGNA